MSKYKQLIFNFLKKWVYKFAIKKIFGVAITALGGIKGWLAKIVFNKVWKEVAKPTLQKIWRKGASGIRKVKYKKKVKDLKNAKTKKDIESSFDNLQ